MLGATPRKLQHGSAPSRAPSVLFPRFFAFCLLGKLRRYSDTLVAKGAAPPGHSGLDSFWLGIDMPVRLGPMSGKVQLRSPGHGWERLHWALWRRPPLFPASITGGLNILRVPAPVPRLTGKDLAGGCWPRASMGDYDLDWTAIAAQAAPWSGAWPSGQQPLPPIRAAPEMASICHVIGKLIAFSGA